MLHNLTERCLLLLLALVVISLCAPFSGAQKSAAPSATPPAATAKSPSPLSTAKAQLDHGDLESGEKTLWSILSSEPTNQEALTMLGVIRGRERRYAEAEALFRRVLQLNPKSIVASRNLAGALLAQDKPDDAIQQYNQTIQLSPQDSDLKIEVAKLDLERGNFAGALSTLDTIKPAHFPPAAVPLKAASLLGVGRRSDAQALISGVQGSSGAALDLAQVFIDANDSGSALKTLSLVNLSLANPVPKGMAVRVYYLKGRALRQKGETVAALTSFRQALAADPKSVETLIAMGEIFAAENKHADSLMMLEKARALSPDSRDVLRHLIVEAMQAGQNDRGLEAAQDLQRKSSELDDRYLVASVMLQQKQYLPASHILEDYVTQRPQDAKAYLGLGMAYLSLLRYADARQALERSLQLNPSLAEGHYQLGLLAGQQGSRQEAIEHWQKAVDLQPHHAQALFFLGTAYLESGSLAEAESAFQRSLAADPSNMKTEYDLALVQNKLGKSEEAKQHFERYRNMQEAEHTTAGNPPKASDHP
jgi:tetratricopeptide (TPR) repeat protein